MCICGPRSLPFVAEPHTFLILHFDSIDRYASFDSDKAERTLNQVKMMRKLHAFMCLNILLIAAVFGQSSDVLTVNNIHFRVNANGLLANHPALFQHGCEVPANSGIHSLYSSGLWIGGLSPMNQLHFAGQQYETTNNGDFQPGPLSIGTASITPSVVAAYDKIWTVTRADVDLHQAFYDCVDDPGCDPTLNFPGYVVPASFLDWPAHGDVTLGQAANLAPFVDRNNDGQYDPTDGDSPCIPGDVAKYFIFNDQKGHSFSTGTPLGVEVHAMVYGFATANPQINNTVFVHYRIINRSTTSYAGCRVGVFVDFDLGNPMDDYIGTDLERNMIYALNGDGNDETGITLGYGQQTPAFGMTILEGPYVESDGLDTTADPLAQATGTGYGDGIIDNERLGLGGSMYIGNSPSGPKGQPTSPSMMFSRIGGFWNDGTHLVYGGGGHYLDPGADSNVTASMVYPGASDPGGLGTGGQAQPAWSEQGVGNMPSDRRAIAGMGEFVLEPGVAHEVDIAFCFARATSGQPAASVSLLQGTVDAARAFYHNLPDDCGWSLDPSLGIQSQPKVRDLLVYPSPTDGTINFELPHEMVGAELQLLDACGRLVLADRIRTTKTSQDLSGLESGTYVLRITSEETIYNGRIAVRR